jgi:tetratricopeptide (TPR) repeat protein
MPLLSLAAAPVLAFIMGAGASAQSPSADDAARVMAFDRFTAGREALGAKRWAEAEAEFGNALRLQPGLAVAHYGLGQALVGQARYAEAADAFLSCRNVFALVRRMDPAKARDLEIRDLRDTLQALAGRQAFTPDRSLETQLEKRLAELQKGATASPPWVPPAVSVALGTAYFEAGALEEAEKEFLRAEQAGVKVSPRLWDEIRRQRPSPSASP